MKNIVLIGMMGCGKTTVGKLLAQRLKKPLIDTDAFIESREGMSVAEIFAAQGESYFRAVETGVAQALALRSDLIVACGGGLPLREQAIAALKESGTVFWLARDPGESYDGLDVSGRPLAQGGREDFLRRYEDRAPIYRQWADVTVTDFTSPVSTAARILEEIL